MTYIFGYHQALQFGRVYLDEYMMDINCLLHLLQVAQTDPAIGIPAHLAEISKQPKIF